jgi:hypothetical protein
MTTRAQIDWGSIFNTSSAMIFMAMAVPIVFRAAEDPYEELTTLNIKINSLVNYLIPNMQESVRGTREHKIELMKQYGLTVLPPTAEMKKYPHLAATDRVLRKAEEELQRMELNLLLKQKRRKELMQKLGMREEEIPPRKVYPALKKFREPYRRE